MAEALSKYLPYETEHVTRSRGPFSKTFGLATKILVAKADLYHVFYIFQDAYLSLKMGKRPIVGHACGSDVRDTLHSRWGWMVRHNLRSLDYILSSQPTIVPEMKEYTSKVEYFPIPIDPQLFAFAPLPKHNLEPTVLYTSPVNFRVKGTDKVLQAVSRIKRPITFVALKYGPDLEQAFELSRRLSTKVKWIDRRPHSDMAACYWMADLIIGNFGVGQLDTTVIEAMSCGRPVVHHLAPEFYRDVPLKSYNTVEDFAQDIEMLLTDRKKAEEQVQRQLDYVNVHYADHAVKRLIEVYEEVKAN
jgi:glycosyltransferase involved in cell wall biosynthesis